MLNTTGVFFRDNMKNDIKLFNGDCIKVMQALISEGVRVDSVIADIPYGTTACEWDTVIPFDKMWDCIKNIRKNNSPVLLFGNEPFNSYLRISNIEEYKYDIYWKFFDFTY